MSSKRFSDTERTAILAYAETYSVKAAAEKYDVSENSIGKWKKGGGSKKATMDKLLKFRDAMVEKELQNPETREKVWNLILQDPTIKAKISNLILEEVA